MKYLATVLFQRARPADALTAVHEAVVEADAPESAAEQMWVHCQNIEAEWKEPPTRSMMVGDFVAVRDESGAAYLCQVMGMGFHVVPLFEGVPA
jgi:hypothetical protein